MTETTKQKIRMKKLGVLIKDARLAAQKSVDECANIIGVTSEIFEDFEKGQKAPSLPELEVFAYSLDVPLTHFWKGRSLSARVAETKGSDNIARLLPLRTRIIGVLLKKARLDTGITIDELAASIQKSSEAMIKFENGEEKIPLPELEILASKLNLNVEYFQDKKGVIGDWLKKQQAVQAFVELPNEIQHFVIKPINLPYLEIAQKLSGLPVGKLRALAESLLEITF